MNVGIVEIEKTPLMGVPFPYSEYYMAFKDDRCYIKITVEAGVTLVQGRFFLKDLAELGETNFIIKQMLDHIRFNLPLNLTINEGLALEKQSGLDYIDIIRMFSGRCDIVNGEVSFNHNGIVVKYTVEEVRREAGYLGLTDIRLGEEDKNKLILMIETSREAEKNA